MKNNETIKPKIPITIRLSEEEIIGLDKLAVKMDISRTALIRRFIIEGMAIGTYSKEIDFIRQITEECLANILEPRLERLIKLQLKTCVTSASTNYLFGEIISRFIPIELREEAQESLEKAKKEAVKFTKERADDL